MHRLNLAVEDKTSFKALSSSFRPRTTRIPVKNVWNMKILGW